MIYSLNEIYASGGQLPIVTLKIDNADIGTLRFVLAYEDMKLDGETYHASAFTIPAKHIMQVHSRFSNRNVQTADFLIYRFQFAGSMVNVINISNRHCRAVSRH